MKRAEDWVALERFKEPRIPNALSDMGETQKTQLLGVGQQQIEEICTGLEQWAPHQLTRAPPVPSLLNPPGPETWGVVSDSFVGIYWKLYTSKKNIHRHSEYFL